MCKGTWCLACFVVGDFMRSQINSRLVVSLYLMRVAFNTWWCFPPPWWGQCDVTRCDMVQTSDMWHVVTWCKHVTCATDTLQSLSHCCQHVATFPPTGKSFTDHMWNRVDTCGSRSKSTLPKTEDDVPNVVIWNVVVISNKFSIMSLALVFSFPGRPKNMTF